MNFPIAQNLQRSLDQWSKAEQHFQNAVQATLAHDDDAYTREMAEFERIKSTWGDCDQDRTVATRQSPSRVSPSRPSGRVSTIAKDDDSD